MLFLKVQKPKPSSKKQVHGENSSEGQKTVQVAGQVTKAGTEQVWRLTTGPAVTHSALTEVENSLGGLGRWQGGSHRWLSRLCLSQPHPGNQNWCRVDRTPVTPTLGAGTDARVGWVTAPLTLGIHCCNPGNRYGCRNEQSKASAGLGTDTGTS